MGSRAHPVFNASYLKPYYADDENEEYSEEDEPATRDDEEATGEVLEWEDRRQPRAEKKRIA